MNDKKEDVGDNPQQKSIDNTTNGVLVNKGDDEKIEEFKERILNANIFSCEQISKYLCKIDLEVEIKNNNIDFSSEYKEVLIDYLKDFKTVGKIQNDSFVKGIRPLFVELHLILIHIDKLIIFEDKELESELFDSGKYVASAAAFFKEFETIEFYPNNITSKMGEYKFVINGVTITIPLFDMLKRTKTLINMIYARTGITYRMKKEVFEMFMVKLPQICDTVESLETPEENLIHRLNDYIRTLACTSSKKIFVENDVLMLDSGTHYLIRSSLIETQLLEYKTNIGTSKLSPIMTHMGFKEKNTYRFNFKRDNELTQFRIWKLKKSDEYQPVNSDTNEYDGSLDSGKQVPQPLKLKIPTV